MKSDVPRSTRPPLVLARAVGDPRTWLVVYLVLLAAVAFWPTPVDRDAGPVLTWIEDVVPWLTYERVEFIANVLLFVPFGALLTLLLRRRRWVLPIALAATIVIEMLQAVLLAERTPALSDIIANVLGAGIGMLVTLALSGRPRRP